AGGKSEAAGVAWDRYAGLVRSVLRGSLGIDAAVEDLLQEVFIIFVRSAVEMRGGSSFRAFLIGVAVRLASVELRRRRVRRWVVLSPTGVLPEVPSAPSDMEGMEALRILHRLLEPMSARARHAFVLRHVHDLEMGE